MGGEPQIGYKLKVPRLKAWIFRDMVAGETLGLTEASRRNRRQTRAKSIKGWDPSVDGKILDNVAGKKLVDMMKHVCLQP